MARFYAIDVITNILKAAGLSSLACSRGYRPSCLYLLVTIISNVSIEQIVLEYTLVGCRLRSVAEADALCLQRLRDN